MGLEGLLGCEMLTTPRCLDSRLTDGVEAVCLTSLPHVTPRKHFFCFWCSFLWRLSKPRRLVPMERRDMLTKSSGLTGLEPAALRLVAQCIIHRGKKPYCHLAWFGYIWFAAHS
jgi:hypothetical protein